MSRFWITGLKSLRENSSPYFSFCPFWWRYTICSPVLCMSCSWKGQLIVLCEKANNLNIMERLFWRGESLVPEPHLDSSIKPCAVTAFRERCWPMGAQAEMAFHSLPPVPLLVCCHVFFPLTLLLHFLVGGKQVYVRTSGKVSTTAHVSCHEDVTGRLFTPQVFSASFGSQCREKCKSAVTEPDHLRLLQRCLLEGNNFNELHLLRS